MSNFTDVVVQKHGSRVLRRFYHLHESGKNHAERRADTAQERQAPYKNHEFKIRGIFIKQGEDAIRKMWARGEAAHKRALERKAGTAKRGFTRRMWAKYNAFIRRKDDRRARHAKYQSKLNAKLVDIGGGNVN